MGISKSGFVWLLVWFASLSAHAAPTFGRYVGVLNHDKTGKQQFAKLDFIVSRNSANDLDLKAVLTLHFGDFKSREYVSFHYDKVRYNVLTGALTFDDAEQALSVFVRKFGGGELVGDVTSIWGGRVGQLKLASEKEIAPSKTLIESVWGEYAGSCGEHSAKLLLYTFRSTEDLAHQAQPFATYVIRANLPIDCVDGQCVNFAFTSGSYNFFAGKEQLSLVGPRVTMKCDVDGNELRCISPDYGIGRLDLSDCRFKRISKEAELPRRLRPFELKGEFPAPSVEGVLSALEMSALQSGEYKGYVFHEYLGRYQAASLNLDVFQGGVSEGGTKIAAHARLFFGDHESPEFIPYRFSEKVYPNPVAGPQAVVLSRIEGNMDAVLQITEVKEGVIRGTWNSLLFGRVGPFELRKEGLPKLPEKAVTVERLSGLYRGTTTVISFDPRSQWLISLVVVPGIKPPFTSENPFAPNLLKGSMYLWPLTPSLEITDGSYDFYTGQFGFLKASRDGRDHCWVGRQTSRTELELHHVPDPGGLTPPLKQKPERFILEKELGS